MLTTSQIEKFNQDGYLIVPDVLEPEVLAQVKAEYTEALRAHYAKWYEAAKVSDPPEGLHFFEMLDRARAAGLEWYQPLDISLPQFDIREETPFHFGPAVFDLLTNARILDVVESLLGAELTSNPIQHVRIKPPQRELPDDEVRAHITATAWHQDRGVGLEEADSTDMLTVWVAVTDATVANGCLQLIPNPPDQMFPHCPKSQTTIADGHIDASKAVPAEVTAGSLVLIHPLTPHSAGPNHSDGYRWSFDIRFNVTGQPTGRPQFPNFIARSRLAPESELRDWRLWKKMWEEARYKLANSTPIDQHRWSADSPACA